MVGTAPISSTRKEVLNENDINSLKQGILSSGVISGCEVTAGALLAVDVSSGTVAYNGTNSYAVSGQSASLTAHATLDKQAIIYYDTSLSQIVVLYGTASAPDSNTNNFERYAPAPPTMPTDGYKVILAQIYIPAATTQITSAMICDKRVFVKKSTVLPANGVYNFYGNDGTLLMQLTEPEGNLYTKGKVLRL